MWFHLIQNSNPAAVVVYIHYIVLYLICFNKMSKYKYIESELDLFQGIYFKEIKSNVELIDRVVKYLCKQKTSGCCSYIFFPNTEFFYW